jgi:hypothetical protein
MYKKKDYWKVLKLLSAKLSVCFICSACKNLVVFVVVWFVDDKCDESYECFVCSLVYNICILYHPVVE